MIRRDGCTQSTRPRTYWRWTKTNGWDDQKRRLHSIDKATYILEMDEDERMAALDATFIYQYPGLV